MNRHTRILPNRNYNGGKDKYNRFSRNNNWFYEVIIEKLILTSIIMENNLKHSIAVVMAKSVSSLVEGGKNYLSFERVSPLKLWTCIAYFKAIAKPCEVAMHVTNSDF